MSARRATYRTTVAAALAGVALALGAVVAIGAATGASEHTAADSVWGVAQVTPSPTPTPSTGQEFSAMDSVWG